MIFYITLLIILCPKSIARAEKNILQGFKRLEMTFGNLAHLLRGKVESIRKV